MTADISNTEVKIPPKMRFSITFVSLVKATLNLRCFGKKGDLENVTKYLCVFKESFNLLFCKA